MWSTSYMASNTQVVAEDAGNEPFWSTSHAPSTLCTFSYLFLTIPRSKYNCPRFIEVKTEAQTRYSSTKITWLKRGRFRIQTQNSLAPPARDLMATPWVTPSDIGLSWRQGRRTSPEISSPCVSSYASNPPRRTPSDRPSGYRFQILQELL